MELVFPASEEQCPAREVFPLLPEKLSPDLTPLGEGQA